MSNFIIAEDHAGPVSVFETTTGTNVTTKEDMDLSESYIVHVFGCVLTAMTILGICGNIIGIIVLHKVQKITPGVRLLKYLAYVDTATLLLVFEDLVLSYFNGRPKMMIVITYGLTCIFFPLLMTIYTLEIYLTVLIACQRSFALAKPLLSSVYMTTSVMNRLIIIVVCFSVLFNIPEWLLFKREYYWDSDMNMTWIRSMWPNADYLLLKDVYFTYVTLLFRAVIPVIVLIICNITIIVSVRKRMVSQSGRNDGDHLAAINIAIIAMSLCTHVTTAVERLVSHTDYFAQITSSLIIPNSSANFIFYCTFGRSFRNTLIGMIKGLKSPWRRAVARDEGDSPTAGMPTHVTSFDTVL